MEIMPSTVEIRNSTRRFHFSAGGARGSTRRNGERDERAAVSENGSKQGCKQRHETSGRQWAAQPSAVRVPGRGEDLTLS